MKKAYYLKYLNPRVPGLGYHRVEADTQEAAITKFLKGTTYTRKQVRVKKRVKKGEKRLTIPVQKR